MAFFKRLSDSLWSYVSPSKTTVTQTPPKTVPQSKQLAVQPRRGSMEEVISHRRSMSPTERIDSWKVGSSSQADDSAVGGRKRKRPVTPSTSTPRRKRRIAKWAEEDRDFTPNSDYEGDTAMDGQEEGEADELASGFSNIRVANSPNSHEEENDENVDLDSTLVLSEEDYNDDAPNRRRVIDLPAEHSHRGVSSDELRAAGWDEDHITLVQKIVMRGFEPLLPQHWQFDYRFLPDALFSTDDKAFISSVRQDHYRGIMALEKLFELGGRTRDRVLLKGAVRPEEQVRRSLKQYMKWANEDAGLDKRTAIPVIALEMKPANTPATVLQDNAREKLARLATRYKEAFRIKQSIEASPLTDFSHSTKLAYQIPQLYAIIASHTLVALVAYKPDDAEQSIKPVAFFDMKDKDYDVWNSLALAIVICHSRNVQMRIAKETGVGVPQPGMDLDDDDEDPDA